MVRKKKEILSLKSKIIRWIFSICLLVYTSITIFILLSTVINSLKSKSDLINNVFGWPKKFLFDSYITVFTEDRFGLYFRNSIFLTFCGTFCCIFLASMVAYGIARYDFKGKELLSSYFLFGMMFPIQISVLPLFIILKKLSLINTMEGMILIYAAGMSLPVYIFQKFFRTVPKSLDESARMDGAKEFAIYSKIVLPLCKPVIFTVALIISVGEWNDFYMPMVFLGKKSCRTLTLAIYNYLNEFLKQMNVSFAAVIITLIPIIIIYFLFSNQIVEGLTGGAVKE
ncbi:carbohydrate ABC transporter permease [Anaerocolumna sp. MB42-C2]|uniref:carbohydrate ABC transporter permease n=1 Tax=Anaerocolumna sp. MB42-C2 TaxID=3070997 RepID=UPI0027E21103|nr:carbohydrate ABC transporter permease [Anaerocolumna sp. MB42-C2]WMJ89945.1 carbohydrate ABC transporter permease [Anaerocolumna sp. MB42-C2]